MKRLVATGSAAALALTLAACGSKGDYHVEQVPVDPNYVGVCVNDVGQRVDDSYCKAAPNYSSGPGGSSVEGFFWGYLLASMSMPRVGYLVPSTVTYRVDDTTHNVYRGGVSRTGGTVDFSKYKPSYGSKVSKPDVAVNSTKYKNVYINQDSTYKQKSGAGSVNKAPVVRNPAPAPRPAPAPKVGRR